VLIRAPKKEGEKGRDGEPGGGPARFCARKEERRCVKSKVSGGGRAISAWLGHKKKEPAWVEDAAEGESHYLQKRGGAIKGSN